MGKINVNSDIQKTDRPVKGLQPKFWGIRKSDQKQVLVKYPQPFFNRHFLPNTEKEYFSYKLFEYLEIPCVKSKLGVDYKKPFERKCIVIEDFLNDDDELIEINGDIGKVSEDYSLKEFLEQTLDNALDDRTVSDKEKQEIMADMARIILADCLVGIPDRYISNIGIIHNKTNDSYKLAPAYDNGRAFEQPVSQYSPILEGIFTDYYKNDNDPIGKISKKIRYMVPLNIKPLDEIFKSKKSPLIDFVLENAKNISTADRLVNCGGIKISRFRKRLEVVPSTSSKVAIPKGIYQGDTEKEL